jgi:hypothetical protein
MTLHQSGIIITKEKEESMPYNFITNQIYNVDYDALFNELTKTQILKSKELNDYYIKRWIAILKEHDQTLMKQFSSKEYKMQYMIHLLNEPELFQQPINFTTTHIYLHFRVSFMIKLVSDSHGFAERIPLSEFTENNTRFYWNPVDKINMDYPVNKQPIIMTTFLSGQYQFLVLDGNHRITMAQKKDHDSIQVLSIMEQSMIDHQLCASSFDQLYYIMHNELGYIHKAVNEGTGDEEVLMKSYLMGKGVQFI